MAIETFNTSMLQDDIVSIAFVSVMYFLDDSRHHGIDIPIVTFQVYPVMEPLTPIYRIFAIAVFGVDRQVIQRQTDCHPFLNEPEKRVVVYTDKHRHVSFN